MKNLAQHNPIHPGVILCEFYLEPLRLNIADLAKELSIARSTLSAIVAGKAVISVPIATKLAEVFKTTPRYWMNLQKNYERWQVGRVR